MASAHCREFLIWRRLRSDTSSSIELSTELCLRDLRNVESEGLCPGVAAGMMLSKQKGLDVDGRLDDVTAGGRPMVFP